MAEGGLTGTAGPGAMRLLRRNNRMARLTGAVLVSSIGDPLSLTISLVLLYAATGSPVAIAGAYMAQMAGVLAVGGLLGAVTDRVDRRRLIVGLEIARWVLVASLPLATLVSVFALYPALMLLGATESLVEPARQAAAAELVDQHEVGTANSLLLTALSLGQAIGFAIAGLALVHLSNPRLLYFGDAVTFLAAGLLVLTLGGLGGGVRTVRLQGGLGRAWRVPGVKPLLIMAGATVFFVGMLNPALLPLSYLLAANGPGAYSVVQICLIAGLFGGSLLAARISTGLRLPAMAVGTALFAIGIFGIWASPGLWPAILGFALSGIGNAVYSVTNISALMQVANTANRGTVMASRFTITQATKALGLGAGAAVTAALGPRSSFALIAAGLLAVGVAFSLYLSLRAVATGRPRAQGEAATKT
ncbi:MAG: MFS transporter [Candidatus Dormibacteraeota bacterium]|nr:MFS transporter [Candidatus Dormibacteraeota bacterium]